MSMKIKYLLIYTNLTNVDSEIHHAVFTYLT